jgi:hypothetical protein
MQGPTLHVILVRLQPSQPLDACEFLRAKVHDRQNTPSGRRIAVGEREDSALTSHTIHQRGGDKTTGVVDHEISAIGSHVAVGQQLRDGIFPEVESRGGRSGQIVGSDVGYRWGERQNCLRESVKSVLRRSGHAYAVK